MWPAKLGLSNALQWVLCTCLKTRKMPAAHPGIDTRMKFSIEPMPGDDAFQQWHDAMKAVARLPLGIPAEFRKKVWLALADNHISKMNIDWEKTKRFTFNERSNPDDNKLGLQIVKDLHRTGCSSFNGQDNEEDRALLKRVLLAYARWNKAVGYCQGFNVLAALILDVMDRKEDDTLKVMIFLIDHVLPESYFANNLRALSVDMAVFRDLLRGQLPQLSRHLDHLQAAARDHTTGANYEPPLTNVFTMQWFLTLFATCLPKATALRAWDSVLLEGSEILLRTALAIWGKLQDRILRVHDADEFYTTMGVLTQEMLDEGIIDADELVKNIYSMAQFPFPQLGELREKYTYNITPFTAAMSAGKKGTKGMTSIFSDDDELDEEDLVDNINCFAAFLPEQLSPIRSRPIGDSDRAQSASAYDISKVSPGAYAANPESLMPNAMRPAAYMERMNLDIDSLKKQYKRLRERQKQAHIILTAANAKHAENQARINRARIEAAAMPHIESPVAINHLFVGKKGMGMKNRKVAAAPRIVPAYHKGGSASPHMRLVAQANAHTPMVHEKRDRTESVQSLSTIASSTTDLSTTELEEKETFRDTESVTTDVSGELTPQGPVSPRGERKLSEGSEDSHYSLNASSAIIISSNTCRSRSGSKSHEEEGDKGEKNSDSETPDDMSQVEHVEKEVNLLLDFEEEEISKGERKEVVSDSDQCHSVESSKTAEEVDSVRDCSGKDKVTKSEGNQTSAETGKVKCEKPAVSSQKEEAKVVESPVSAKLPVTAAGEGGRGKSVDATATEERTAHYVAKLTYKTHKKNQDQLPSQQKNGDPVVRRQSAVSKNSHGQKVGQHSANQRTSKSASLLHNNPRTFYPFPNRHVNSSRTENGIRLGLYSAPEQQNGKQNRGKPGVKNISRAQLNACLHRQYMAEIKQQAKSK